MKRILLTLALLGLILPVAAPAQASDTTRPTVLSATIANDGVTITITFSEPMAALTATSLNSFTPIWLNAQSTFDGYPSMVGGSHGSISQGGTTLVMTLGQRVLQNQRLGLEFYRSSNPGVVQDLAGNKLANIAVLVIDTSTLPAQPVVQSAVLSADGRALTITFSQNMGSNSGSQAWGVLRSGLSLAYSTAALTGGSTQLVLTLNNPVLQGQSVTLRYNRNTTTGGSVPFQDQNGIQLLSFGGGGANGADLPITNNSTVQPDTTPPGLVTFGVPNPAETTAQFIVEFTESASFNWVVLPASSAQPPRDAVRFRNATGRVGSGNGSFTGTLVVGNITSLTSGTDYVLYVVAEDPSVNVSAVFSQPFRTAGSAPVVLSLVSAPTLSLNGDTVASTAAVWSTGTPTQLILACTQSSSAASGAQSSAPSFVVNSCARLWTSASVMGIPTDLSTAFIDQGDIPGQPNLKVPFSQWSSTYRHIVRYDFVTVAPNTRYVWSATREYLPISNVSATSSEAGTAEMEQAPVLFGGPKIASLVKAAAASAPSSQLQFVGKRMNKVTSASVGGLQATISVTRSTLSITVPEGLAPGIYNLVLESTDGRITIMRFVTVR